MLLNVSISDVRRVKEKISFDELVSGLKKSPILDRLPPKIESRDAFQSVRAYAPLARDIVEWMQEATAGLSVLQGTAADYERAGSAIAVAMGDAFIPTVSTTGIAGVSMTREEVKNRGAGQCIIKGQKFDVPAPGKITIIGRDFLAWATIPDIIGWGGAQWNLALMNWLELARSPIGEKVRFASIQGFVAPQFFMISTAIPTPIQMLNLSLQSDKPQTLSVMGRSASDYRTELFNLPVDIQEGETNISILVRGVPVIQPYILHAQPSNGSQTTVITVSTRPM